MANFFHTPKPRQFNIEPRFWDPEKENRDARERRIKAELGIKDTDGNFRPYIAKGEFRKGLTQSKWSANKQRRRSNTRLIVLVVLLLLLFYFILN